MLGLLFLTSSNGPSGLFSRLFVFEFSEQRYLIFFYFRSGFMVRESLGFEKEIYM